MEYTLTYNYQSQFIEMFDSVDSFSALGDIISDTFPGEWGNDPTSSNAIKVIRTTNFTNEGRLDLSDVVKREIDSKKMTRKRLKKGDTILERSGGTKDNPVGRVVFFDEEGDYLFNNFTQVLRPKDSVNPVYLFYSLYNSYNLNKAAMRAMASQTTGIQNLSMSDYMAKQIKMPSKDGQDKFEAIYRHSDKSKFDGFKSQFIEMFGEDIPQSTIEECANTFIDGEWIESKDQSESGIRLIQTGNVGNGVFKDNEEKSRFISKETFDRLHCTQILEGDILVSRLPDPIGRGCIVPKIDKAITAVDCTIIRLKSHILPEYFIAYTQTPQYQNQIKKAATGTTRRRISRGNLAKVKIPVPPMELQEEFAAIVRQADKSKYYVQNKLNYICHILTNQIQ